jgi:hypothetical protein
MRKPRSVQALTEFGRTRLSKSFFMRDFLYSDIATIHGLDNLPDDPDLAIASGTRLCEDLLEPLQDAFGRLAVRSSYRSAEINDLGCRLQAQASRATTARPIPRILPAISGTGAMPTAAWARPPASWCRASGIGSKRTATGRSSPGGSTTICPIRCKSSSRNTGRSISPGTNVRNAALTVSSRHADA